MRTYASEELDLNTGVCCPRCTKSGLPARTKHWKEAAGQAAFCVEQCCVRLGVGKAKTIRNRPFVEV